jgi:hypothetical protein
MPDIGLSDAWFHCAEYLLSNDLMKRPTDTNGLRVVAPVEPQARDLQEDSFHTWTSMSDILPIAPGFQPCDHWDPVGSSGDTTVGGDGVILLHSRNVTTLKRF